MLGEGTQLVEAREALLEVLERVIAPVRLAVMFAMQPDAKRRRTLAMSYFGVSTGTPTASIEVTSERTIARMISRSWIMRSNTTSMSRLRSGKALSRCTSMNRGEVTRRIATSTAGLCRSVWPTARVAFPARPAAIMPSASLTDRDSGFSTSTGMPRSRNGTATSLWSSVGTATTTASTSPRTSRKSVSPRVDDAAAISAARSARVSTTATSLVPSIDDRMRA